MNGKGAAPRRKPWYRQLHWLIILGMAVGLVAGLGFGTAGLGKPFGEWMYYPGTIFVNLLKMIVIPLVFTSIVLGVASLGDDLSRLGRIGLKAFIYYTTTTALAVVLGLVLVNVIRPGDRGQQRAVAADELLLRQDALPIAANEARIALVNGAQDVPQLSLSVVTGPTVFEGVGFGVSAAAVAVSPGVVDLRLTDAAGKEVTTIEGARLEAGQVTTVVVTGRASTGTLRARVLAEAQQDPAHVTVRFVHGAPSLPALVVQTADGDALAEPFAWDGDVAIVKAMPGQDLVVRLAGGTGAVLATIKATDVGPGLPWTMLVLGRRPTAEPVPLADVLLGVVPANLLGAFVNGDVLGIIFFGLFFGIALSLVGAAGKPVVAFIEGLFQAVMKMTDVIMWTAPIGVAALLGKLAAEMGPEALVKLAWYMATVLIGLLVHGVVVLPLLLWLVGRTNPLTYFRRMAEPLVTAFSTASSSATLPVSIEAVEKKAGVSNRIASFVLPLGATINMDGTALYEAVAALFIAQIYGIELTMADQIVIFLTATLAAIGAAGIPSAGLVTMLLVLRAVGLPDEGIALIVGVDRLLDMVRTTVNVWGDLVGARIVAGSEGEVTEPEPAV